MSALHDPRLRAEPLLDMALGLRSTIARFDTLVTRYAPPKLPSAGVTQPATDGDVAQPAADDGDREAHDICDDAWTLLVLGAIALRGRLDRELARAAVPTMDVRVDRTPPDEGLLR
jgi:hypothetical protein